MSLSVVEPMDGHVVAMSGAVSPGMVIALYRTIAAAVDAGRRVIVIDLGAVTFLGAQTAGLFCGALRLVERRGVTLEVLGGPPRLQLMLAAVTGSRRVTQRDQLKIAPAIVQITYIALLGSVVLGAALAFGLGDRDVAARLLDQAYSKGQENKDQAKDDMQLGKDRAQDQARAAKDRAESRVPDGHAPAAGAYRSREQRPAHIAAGNYESQGDINA